MSEPVREGVAGRGHRSEAHTADAAIQAWATDLPALFEEAAGAVADMAAAVPAGTPARQRRVVEVRGADLEGLAFAWLNELIGLAEVEHSAVGAVTVETVESSGLQAGSWRIAGHVALHGYEDAGVRALRHVKAATFHGLRVRRQPGGWSLHAVVDL